MKVKGTFPPLFIVTLAEMGNCQLEVASLAAPDAPVTVIVFTFTDPVEPDLALVLDVLEELFGFDVDVDVSAGDVTLGFGEVELDV